MDIERKKISRKINEKLFGSAGKGDKKRNVSETFRENHWIKKEPKDFQTGKIFHKEYK